MEEDRRAVNVKIKDLTPDAFVIEHRMRVREPVHGMQGVFGKAVGFEGRSEPRCYFSPPMRIFRQTIESEGKAFRTV